MPLKRVRVPASKPQGRHFATKTKAKHFAPRTRRVTTAITVGAFALGCVGTVAVRAAAGDDNTANAAGAVTKSQPAAAPAKKAAPLGTGMVDPAVKQYMTAQILKAVPAGPGKVAKQIKMILDSPTTVTPALDQDGIPAVALQAYQHAASVLGTSDPSCQLPWQLLAAIGRVESDHGRFGGSQLLANGDTTRPIYGIPLDGRPGVALIRDTDGGKLDGDPNFDRAVGPMQFIPSTWEADGVDGNGDGKADPNNIFDAALTAAQYLCKSGGNMTNPAQEAAAVRTYNDADQYVNVVLALATSYEHGDAPTLPMPSGAQGTFGNFGGSQGGFGGSQGGFGSGSSGSGIPWQPPTATHTTPGQGTAPTHTTKGSDPRPGKSSQPSGGKSSTKPTTRPSKPQPITHHPKPPVTSNPTTDPNPASSSAPTSAPTSSAPSSAPTTSAPTSSAPTTSAPTSSAPTDNPTLSAPTSSAPTTTAPTTTPTHGTWSPGPGEPTHFGGRPPHRVIIIKIVNEGWAPAMRKVVIKILTDPHFTQHQGQSNNGHNPAPGTDPGRRGGSRSTGDHQDGNSGHQPGHQTGTEPGHGTSGQPGHQPGSNPGRNSGNQPGHQPGSEPGHGTNNQPGRNPGSNSGHEPGHQTGTEPGNQSSNQQDHQSGDQQTDDQPVGNS